MVFGEKEKRYRRKGKIKIKVEFEDKIFHFELSGWRRYFLALPIIAFYFLAINWFVSLSRINELKRMKSFIEGKSADQEFVIMRAKDLRESIETLDMLRRSFVELVNLKDVEENRNISIFDGEGNKSIFLFAGFDGLNENERKNFFYKIDSIAKDMKFAYDKLKERNLVFEYFPTISPVKGGFITSGFGYRTHPVHGNNQFHSGIDISVSYGSPVYATASGKVIRARSSQENGKYIVIKHINNITTVYLHLSSILVREGDFVKKGQIIGKVGDSGLATGPHLHYEVTYNGRPIDPLLFIIEE